MNRHTGTISIGVRLPIIKAGDNLKDIIIEGIKDSSEELGRSIKDRDIICITESLVARATSNYVTISDVVDDLHSKYIGGSDIAVVGPIYSRNRFSLILKAIARAFDDVYLVLDKGKDEVGNDKKNPFTNIDIEEFYKEVIESENANCHMIKDIKEALDHTNNVLYCRNHVNVDEFNYINSLSYTSKHNTIHLYSLSDLCASPTKHDDVGYNEEFGLLGSNKANEDTLKLFPKVSDCKEICESLKDAIKEQFNASVEVMVYGDGCFKDPVCHIWEFADPVVSPYYTSGLNGTPNEIKIKYFADKDNANSDDIIEVIKAKDEDLTGKMDSQGTTPRNYTDLIGSLADLTSGSGDKGTPVVWISGYFDNYASE